MVGCFGFSIFNFVQKMRVRNYRSCGLEARLVVVDNGQTIMSCWVPKQDKERSLATTVRKPALVLLHGFGCTGLSWHFQVGGFIKEYDLYIPDLVFFGDSTSTSKERSEIWQAECVASLLQELSVPRYSIIGTSYGGFVAYRIAHLYPDRVEKVVISSSAACMDPSSNELVVKKHNLKSIKDLLLPTTAEEVRRVQKLVFHRQPPFRIPNWILEDFLEVMVRKNWEERNEVVDGLVLGKYDSPPLPVINQDVLIIWGEFDELFNVKWAHRLKEHIGTQAEVYLVKNAGHVPQLEKSAEYNKQALAFLSKTFNPRSKSEADHYLPE